MRHVATVSFSGLDLDRSEKVGTVEQHITKR